MIRFKIYIDKKYSRKDIERGIKESVLEVYHSSRTGFKNDWGEDGKEIEVTVETVRQGETRK